MSDEFGYILDPHGAVGYHGLAYWRTLERDEDRPGIVLATAHPGKFRQEVEKAIGRELTLPAALLELTDRMKKSHLIENDYGELKKWLLKL